MMLTTDTQFANWVTDPANGVPRVYLVTVRGEVRPEVAAALPAASVVIRKSSARESHLTVELTQGRNREVRRMFASIGREVTRLKRVRFGGLEIGDLEPGEWRPISLDELRRSFPRWAPNSGRPTT